MTKSLPPAAFALDLPSCLLPATNMAAVGVPGLFVPLSQVGDSIAITSLILPIKGVHFTWLLRVFSNTAHSDTQVGTDISTASYDVSNVNTMRGTPLGLEGNPLSSPSEANKGNMVLEARSSSASTSRAGPPLSAAAAHTLFMSNQLALRTSSPC